MIDSPVFRRIGRPERIPSTPLTALIAGATTALALAITLPALLPGVDTVWRSIAFQLSVVFRLVTAGLPIVLAGLAAWPVHTLRNEDAFDMVPITGLTPPELARGIIWGAAYRLRVLLAIGAGLATVEFAAVLLSMSNYAPDPPATIPPLWLVVGLVTLRACAVLVTRVGWMLVGVVLGAVAALAIKRSNMALAAAPALAAVLVAASTSATQLTINALFGTVPPYILGRNLVPVVASLLPLLTLMGLWRVGLRAVEKP